MKDKASKSAKSNKGFPVWLWIVAAAILVAVVCLMSWDEGRVDISVLAPPTAVPTEEKTLLVYELFAVNRLGKGALKPVKVEVAGAARRRTGALAVYEGESLVKNAIIVTADLAKEKGKGARSFMKEHIHKMTPDEPPLAKDMGILIYIWVQMPWNKPVPLKLLNRIVFDKFAKDGKPDGQLIEEHIVDVRRIAPVVISPPLTGHSWAAAGAPAEDSYHRRAALAIDGKLYLAQRFAIDYVVVSDDGKYAEGDLTKNESYYCFGKKIHAVADGTVTSIQDGLAENVPGEFPKGLTIEQIEGNHVVMDIGEGNYVFYAHMQPGSLRVKPGDEVKCGDCLGLLGNTGNSDAPHLHIHVCNGPDPVRSEGLPFVYDSFTYLGNASGDIGDVVDGVWQWVPLRLPRVLHNLMPLKNYIVGFSIKIKASTTVNKGSRPDPKLT